MGWSNGAGGGCALLAVEAPLRAAAMGAVLPDGADDSGASVPASLRGCAVVELAADPDAG